MTPCFTPPIPGPRIAILASCCLLLACPAGADSTSLTLQEAVRLALSRSPGLEAAKARVDAARGRQHVAGQWANPELEIATEDWPLGGGGFAHAKQTLGLAQTLPYPGKKKLDRRIGGTDVRIRQAELGGRRSELVREVKTAFVRALAAERKFVLTGDLSKLAEAGAKAARERVEAGDASPHDQLRAEIEWEQTRTEEAASRRARDQAVATLCQWVGQPARPGIVLQGSLEELGEPVAQSCRPETWLAGHPEVLAARLEVEQAELEEKRAALEPYPDPRVRLAGGRVGESDESVLELSLALPLPLFDRSKGRRQEAAARSVAARAELAAVEQRLVREWTEAIQEFHSALEQAARYRDRILPRAEEALRLVGDGYAAGKFGFLELVDARRTAAGSRLVFQQKLLDSAEARVRLESFLPAPASPESPTPRQP